jgi:hypothetical protein
MMEGSMKTTTEEYRLRGIIIVTILLCVGVAAAWDADIDNLLSLALLLCGVGVIGEAALRWGTHRFPAVHSVAMAASGGIMVTFAVAVMNGASSFVTLGLILLWLINVAVLRRFGSRLRSIESRN